MILDKYYTLNEAAKLVGVSHAAMSKAARQNKFKYKVVRPRKYLISGEELQKYIENRQHKLNFWKEHGNK